MKNSDTCFCPMDQEKPPRENLFSERESFIIISDKSLQPQNNSTYLIPFSKFVLKTSLTEWYGLLIKCLEIRATHVKTIRTVRSAAINDLEI